MIMIVRDETAVLQAVASNGPPDLAERKFDQEERPVSLLETHLMDAVAVLHLVLLLNDLAGVVLEDSHYRSVATFLDAVAYGAAACMDVKNGFDPTTGIVLSSICLVGLAVHAREPGIFTKDKKSSSSSKGKEKTK